MYNCNNTHSSKHAHAWHLNLRSTNKVKLQVLTDTLFCCLIRLDLCCKTGWQEDCKSGAWWIARLFLVAFDVEMCVSLAAHTLTDICEYEWEDRHWQESCWTLIIALMWCGWGTEDTNCSHPCGKKRLPDLPQCICLVPASLTLVMWLLCKKYVSLGNLIRCNMRFCIELSWCHLCGKATSRHKWVKYNA